jgi:fluoride exporter
MTAAGTLMVLVGGFAGGVARLLLSEFVAVRLGAHLPWGTLAVNVAGSFLAGLLAGLAASGGALAGPLAHDLLTVGFCGGFTTVSAFALQTVALGRDGAGGRAAANVAVSVVLAMAAVAAGHWAGTAA